MTTMSSEITAAREALLKIWPSGAECEHTHARLVFAALDAAEKRDAELVEALTAMCGQYLTVRNGKLHHDYMSAGELAFEVLGWEDSGHVLDPEHLCEVSGCGEAWSCGVHGKDGKYHTLCNTHYNEWIEAGNQETPEQADARWTSALIHGGMTADEAEAHKAKIRAQHAQWMALREKMPDKQALEIIAKGAVNIDSQASIDKANATSDQLSKILAEDGEHLSQVEGKA
jgi:hypothetical protein